MSITKLGPDTVPVQPPKKFTYARSKKGCFKEAITTGVQNDGLLLAGKLNMSLTHFEVLDLAFPGEIFKMFR
jgi:hypothetical protein